MHVSWEISFGNVMTIVATVVTMLVAYHKWDKKIEERHLTNGFRMGNLEKTVEALENTVKNMQTFMGSLWGEFLQFQNRKNKE